MNDIIEKVHTNTKNANVEQSDNLSAETSIEKYNEVLLVSIKTEDAEDTTSTDSFRNTVGCVSQSVAQATNFLNEHGEYMTETVNYGSYIKKEDGAYEDVKTDRKEYNLNPDWEEDVKRTITVDVSSSKVNCSSGQTTVELDKYCDYEHGKSDSSEVIKCDSDIKNEKADLEDLYSDKVMCRNNPDTSESVRIYQCKFCEYKAKTKRLLMRHFKAKHDENSEWYRCELCEYKSKYRDALRTHFLLQHDASAEWYQCHFCKYRTKHKRSLTRHSESKHNQDSEWYQCPDCSFKTKGKFRLKSHFKYKHDTAEWFHCQYCEYRAKSKSNLTKHFINIHNQVVEWHECKQCTFKTKDKASLKMHFKNEHKWYQCEFCEFKTKYKSNVRLHFEEKHENNNSKLHQQHDENDKWYQCHLCVFRTKYRKNLKEHLECQHDSTGQ